MELETNEWCLVSEAVDEELSFIENTNMVSLVLNLEVAVRGSGIFEIDRVLTVDQLGKLCGRSRTCPCALVLLTRSYDFVVAGRVGGSNVWQLADDLGRITSSLIHYTILSADIDLVSRAGFECRHEASGSDLIVASALE